MPDLAELIGRVWRRAWCAIGHHRSLDVIQSYGAAQHIGCRYCGREMAIHHGLRQVVPWDSELAQLYTDAGYDVEKATLGWRKWGQRRKALHSREVGDGN